MKVALVLCALVACTVAAQPLFSAKYAQEIAPAHDDFTYGTFITQLDHFTPQDERTLEFEYTIKRDYHTPGGPLFVYINDAGIFTTQWLEFGLIHDLARDLGGALFTADHRYFRSNIPTPVLANASESNLRFLTVEQSLADIAVLLTTIRRDVNDTDAPIVLWGTGYGATLATWAKQRYPHLITGVLASSGIFEYQTHSNEQYEHLSSVIRIIGGQECTNTVSTAFEQIETLVRAFELEKVTEDLNLCHFPTPRINEDLALLFRGLVQTIVEYLNRFHYTGVQNFCRDLAAIEGDAFTSFATWIRYVFGDSQCYDISYFTRLPALRDITWGSNATRLVGDRQHLYYQCTQLGNFPVNVNGNTLFGRVISQDFYYEGCEDLFEEDYDYMQLRAATQRLNVQFGAKNPAVTNVIYTNGQLDINLPFAVRYTQEPGSYVIDIDYAAKSADLLSVQTQDSDSLAAAKRNIRSIIAVWVGRPWV